MVQPPGSKLVTAVSAVDWNENVRQFSLDPTLSDRITEALYKIAVWSKQIETADSGNDAVSFMRETQIQGHYASTLIALSLYKPCASALRAMFESVLYYTYFRSHPAELRTLVDDPEFYISKSYVIEFHRRHAPDFVKKQTRLALLSDLSKWYSDISAIIHGQIPGKWVTHVELKDIAFDEETAEASVSTLQQGADLVHKVLLCTVSIETWYKFSKDSKTELLKGLSGAAKSDLGLPSI